MLGTKIGLLAHTAVYSAVTIQTNVNQDVDEQPISGAVPVSDVDEKPTAVLVLIYSVVPASACVRPEPAGPTFINTMSLFPALSS